MKKNLIPLKMEGGDNYYLFIYFIPTVSSELLKISISKSKCEHELKGFAYPNLLQTHKILKKYYHN